MGKPLNTRQKDKRSRLARLCQDWRILSFHLSLFVAGEERRDEDCAVSLGVDADMVPMTMAAPDTS